MQSCWGLTSGQAGMAAQVRALALALKLTPQMKTVDIRKAFTYLPNEIYLPFRKVIVPYLLAPKSDSLLPPYPELVISCGRRAALVAMGLRQYAPDTKFIHIQDPHLPSNYFDVVIAMQHDKITGLLGGSTNKYTLTSAGMQQIISSLQELLSRTQGCLLITPSRRTGEKNISTLRDVFAGNPRVYIYDFTAENPYLGLLARADFIVVTNDSVNMMSEAQATGKPIYILPLPEHTNTKPSRFAEKLISDGIAKTISYPLEKWIYPRSGEVSQVSEAVLGLLR